MTAGDDGDRTLVVVVLAVAGASAVVYLGAALAAIFTHAALLDASPSDTLRALVELARRPGAPRDAWPPSARSQLPGPIPYWCFTALTAMVVAAGASMCWMRFAPVRVGTKKRSRLGVEVRGRLATARELGPLVIDGATRGRFTLGRVHGRLVATEHPDHPRPSRRVDRALARGGNRSAVAVIGPSQCGKTSNVVCSILEWDGPAVLSSVKSDLLALTVVRRAQLGDVWVFDPLEELDGSTLPKGWRRCGWSPLQSAGTIGGAIAVANALLDAAPAEGITNATYWSRKGEALLWPLLFAAAIGRKSMSDVVGWLATQDGQVSGAKANPKASEVRKILTSAAADQRDPQRCEEALFALRQFEGFWLLHERVRSDVFSTAQTLVQPWEDPRLARASALEPQVDLAWLLSGTGRNTLYVSQPLKGADRLSVIFGGLLGDVIAEQAYDVAKRTGRALPDLLVVIDEAGNTPVRWLPQVASTCSGIGITLVTVWQSKAQIDARYQALADSVLTNHATKMFFAGTSDESTGKYAMFLAGDEEVENRTINESESAARRSTGIGTTRVPLLPASVLRRAGAGHALLIHGTLPPAHLVARHVTNEPHLQQLTAGTIDPPPQRGLDKTLADALHALRVERGHEDPTA
jgi:type IV secretion system protein VirD4